MSPGGLAHPTFRRAAWGACAVGIGLCLALVTAMGADASDAVLDPGPVVSSSALSSGHGWAVWGRRDASGQVSLVAVHGHGAPSVLAVRPLRRLDGLDVGIGPGGAPTVAYHACRGSTCAYYRFALPRGPETRMRVPAPPRGCRQQQPVIARQLFVVRWSARAGSPPCRVGIYHLRGRRLVLRHRVSRVESYDVDRGRLAVSSMGDDDIVRVVVRRLRGGASRLVARDEGALYDDPTGYQLSWDAGTLWMGLTEWGSPGTFGRVMRVRWTPNPVCTYDPREYRVEDMALVQWAFLSGRVFYTAGTYPGPTALRERTDPPPRYVRALAPCGSRAQAPR
jgi:hypothetical protein